MVSLRLHAPIGRECTAFYVSTIGWKFLDGIFISVIARFYGYFRRYVSLAVKPGLRLRFLRIFLNLHHVASRMVARRFPLFLNRENSINPRVCELNSSTLRAYTPLIFDSHFQPAPPINFPLRRTCIRDHPGEVLAEATNWTLPQQPNSTVPSFVPMELTTRDGINMLFDSSQIRYPSFVS